MEPTVCFRNFEERDIDFVHRCKNDEKLNSMIVGAWHPFTYDEAVKWVHGCMGDHESFKFWAVCTNDEEQRIVGWVSLSQIDYMNHSACHHGIVIGDSDYRDGAAMFEAMLFSMDYAFNVLNVHRLYGSCMSEHKVSPYMSLALGFSVEGKQRQAVMRNDKYNDVINFSILENEYYELLSKGYYNIDSLIIQFIKIKREYNKRNI